MNSAVGGGAIATSISSSSGIGQIVNSTFISNSSTNPGYGGASYGVHRFLNSILALNTDASGLNNCGGIGSSNGFNLSDSGPGDCNLTNSSDLVTQKPLLGPLQNNGGASLTMGLLTGSPGIDQGTNIGCPGTDARGLARPIHGVCDIGAFESQ